MLMEKGKELHLKMGIVEECKFSDGWLSRFKLRHGIRRLDISGEKRSQKNAWMDQEIFLDWFIHTFVPSVRNHLRENGKSEDTKVWLLLDNCRAHPPKERLVDFRHLLPTQRDIDPAALGPGDSSKSEGSL
ncbi:hypothetical protein JTE90_004161 [Oedothorax gibbosus]|uniref:HTH CENPB-type domain-containing protein n=1 Tax=Oedothorax gibbosus TaxID=931172 RepID=A0AAV6TUR5_9ARAC|nr:hypothetical protein JTE90_004161 [Oedothorax gibbosus]